MDRLEEMDVSPPTLSRMDSEVFSGVREGREKQWGEGEYDEQLIREQASADSSIGSSTTYLISNLGDIAIEELYLSWRGSHAEG